MKLRYTYMGERGIKRAYYEVSKEEFEYKKRKISVKSVQKKRKIRCVSSEFYRQIKIEAYKKTNRALLNGVIKIENQCQVCGSEGESFDFKKRLHAHHPSYLEPLIIIWLCPSCHKKVHSGLINIQLIAGTIRT